MMSGPTLSYQQLQNDPLTYANQLGDKLNCPKDNTTVLVNCLNKQTAENIVVATGEMQVLIHLLS